MRLLFALLLLLGHRSFCQHPIDTTQVIQVGGIKQYVKLQGKDRSNPLLLFLHGGPGGSLMNKAGQMTGKLQEQFVVVHWDQRETGETLKLNKTTGPLALEMFYTDTHDLIDSLLKQFNQPKLFLAGYSWGTGMGFQIAGRYPELLYAYIAISPVIHQWESERISLEMLRDKMGKKARKELAKVKIPFENAEQLYYHRKWLLRYDGQKMLAITFPKSLVMGWGVTWFDVWKKSCDINLFQSMPEIHCPVYFFAGKRDYNTNASITQQYFEAVKAPKKDLFLFLDAGHTLPETDPELFQENIIEKILPDTFNPQ